MQFLQVTQVDSIFGKDKNQQFGLFIPTIS